VAEDVVMEGFVVAFRRLEVVPEERLPWPLACARRLLAEKRGCAVRSAGGPFARVSNAVVVVVSAVVIFSQNDGVALRASAGIVTVWNSVSVWVVP
jgi:hypothetical protein